jgi:formate/nitrite transporter FocA (FNT family)
MAMAYPYNQPLEVVHNAYTPQQTTEIASRMGAAKARMRIDKIFASAFMAGAILAFACAAVSVVNTAPWYQENAPGVIKLFAAMIFPFGLVAIVLTGADLCTGSFMVSFSSQQQLRSIVVFLGLTLFCNSSQQSLLCTVVPASSRC